MRVFIVRHGETDWNTSGKLQGQIDVPLNQNGRDQAQRIANRLRLEAIDVIITSPLRRAKRTARYIAKYHPHSPIVEEKELQEVSFGTMEGLTREQYITRPWIDLSPHEEFIFKFEKGESLEGRVERLIPRVEEWKKQYRNKTILISTHGYIKKAILLAFKVVDFPKLSGLKFHNTALTIIRPFDLEQIELLNDASHLDDE